MSQITSLNKEIVYVQTDLKESSSNPLCCN